MKVSGAAVSCGKDPNMQKGQRRRDIRERTASLTPGMELRERDFRVAQPREIPKAVSAFGNFQKAGLVLPRC